MTTTALEKFEETCHEDNEEQKILGQQDEIRALGSAVTELCTSRRDWK